MIFGSYIVSIQKNVTGNIKKWTWDLEHDTHILAWKLTNTAFSDSSLTTDWDRLTMVLLHNMFVVFEIACQDFIFCDKVSYCCYFVD